MTTAYMVLFVYYDDHAIDSVWTSQALAKRRCASLVRKAKKARRHKYEPWRVDPILHGDGAKT
jgi:hypothetical protein